MQSPRVILRRILLLRPSKSPSAPRPFTRNANFASRGRPQIPFLSVPLARNHQFRYLTTERKRWLAYEFYLGLKYTVYVWAIVGFSVAGYWSIQQEWLERKYPTPHEWGFITRLRFRLAKWAPDRTDLPQTDWVLAGNYAKNILERLGDEKIEGAGLVQDKTEGGKISGYDITAKSEPWRRGYYEALMLCAKVAEHLDDHVVEKVRHVVFPADQVQGPSNPNPKPISHGSPSAPHENDCERAYEAPETFYQKILATTGFTPKQKMDAALEYASWLDYKGQTDAAELTYEWALALATESSLPSPPPYDPQSYILQDAASPPSTNILNALTALATHKARTSDISSALPILISVLRARRSLPQPQSATKPLYTEVDETQSTSPWTFQNILGVTKRLLTPPAYPPPPDDGSAPPLRDAGELCEEAGLNLYIGEIIYASASTNNSHSTREDGLAWTREAVDLAEEQLHKLTTSDTAAANIPAAKKTCKECLSSGLDNWRAMVARLAREEREKKQESASASTGSWFGGFWGDGKTESTTTITAATNGGRWTAEENVVKERTRRAMEIIEEMEVPKAGLGSLFQA
ncbi:uncharacterized protein F4822DRAFT_126099 [Hypoxylon trugodes]|uniref:uncharacterized protein n=1 Tax=Hypoxylon trugodes TaxID=326681 RepID=UPI0021903992|nr:uncharacterized protein F4822DRAFT_126099 [Hypoxylon trugodes]KAI1392341.1 hypothetical protein F4822DRAFT_126099 [Hypoxylon trugodes]